MEMQEITFENMDFAREVFGPGNAHLETVAGMTGLKVESRGNTVFISGEDPAHGRPGLPVFRPDLRSGP
jgi:phosphate starvation-inducible protein PhoH and related proteins